MSPELSHGRRRLIPLGAWIGLLLLGIWLPTHALDLINTVAGGGVGDGFAASDGGVNGPVRTITDPSGNIYIADISNHRVRKIATGTGIISTIGGNGQMGSAGVGGPAVDANIEWPSGLALDSAGNLYVTDRGLPDVNKGNHRVCKISATTGILTVVAGNGTMGFSGDGGLATQASLNWPTGITFDSSGNLYIADQRNHRVRKVSVSTGIISTVAGIGTGTFAGDGMLATAASLNNPNAIGFDSTGNFYISDEYNNRIRKVSLATGLISTVAGNGTAGYAGDNGPATSAELHGPGAVTFDNAGGFYIADSQNREIRYVSGGTITTVAGNLTSQRLGDGGQATAATLGYFWDVALTKDVAQNIIFADYSNFRVRFIDRSSGIITTITGGGGGDGRDATTASLVFPTNVAVDSAGNLFIVDYEGHRIRKVDANTGLISTVAGTGAQGFSGDTGQATLAQLSHPAAVAVDASGNLFIADKDNNRIRRVGTDGVISTVAGTGGVGFSGDGVLATSATIYGPQGVAVDSANNLFFADSYNHRLRKVDAGTGFISTIAGDGTNGLSGDGGPSTASSLGSPFDLDLDSAGNLYVATRYGVRWIAAGTGIISSVQMGGNPTYGIAVDGSGHLFVSTSVASVVRIDVGTGESIWVAGNGIRDFYGDGGPPTSAATYSASGLAIGPLGELFIADNNNQRVRKVTFGIDPAPTLLAMETTALTFVTSGPAKAITATTDISDVGNTNLTSARIKISGNYQNGQDTLSFVNTANITGSWNVGLGALTLTGLDTLANYKSALRSVTFQNTSGSPVLTTRSVSFQVFDGSLASNTTARSVTIAATGGGASTNSTSSNNNSCGLGAGITGMLLLILYFLCLGLRIPRHSQR